MLKKYIRFIKQNELKVLSIIFLFFSINLAVFNGGSGSTVGVFLDRGIPYFNFAIFFCSVKGISLCCIRIQYNGKYDFRLTDPATNVDSIAHARFTYVFSTTDGKEWKIQTHHSSLLPETDETHRLRG